MKKYNKQFEQVYDFANVNTDIIYFCFLDSFENILLIYDEIKNIDELRIEMYRDVYSCDLWYLEVFSGKASKKTAVRFLRQEFGFDKVVGFGDNLNDLPLFEGCDECYAVSNAKNELKEKATAIIGSNEEDGVAKWVEENLL